MNVTKRDGSKEPLDIGKLHKVVAWACEGISNVSMSELELSAELKFHDGITSSEIQRTLTKAAADLITEQTPNYQYVAGRLVAYDIQKIVNGGPNHPRLYDHVKTIVDDGFYASDLIEKYTEEEWDELEALVDYSRENEFEYAAMETFRGKYLVRNRKTGKIMETPMQAYIVLCATAMINEPTDKRIGYVKDMFGLLCDGTISLPTPIMAGLRTTEKQFSSCVLVETGDSLDTITSAASVITKYVSKKAGIGIGAGEIRAENSPIRNGAVSHTGTFPFYRLLDSAVRSCSQGSVRQGSASLNYLWWHRDFMDIVELKNRTGTDETRLRHMDYVVQLNRLFYERFLQGKDVSLFSPSEVEGLYDAFYEDQDEFKRLYEKAEQDESIERVTISASEVMSKLVEQRKETGRVYIMNVDNVNIQGTYIPKKAATRMTNLCVEVTTITNPLTEPRDENGEIGICTLAAINYGNIVKLTDFEKPARIIVRALNNILEYQEYPVPAAKKNALGRRPLGVGIVNMAYWMAKNDMTYSEPNLAKISDMVEAQSYWLHKASADMAVERGACKYFNDTKYSQGIFPIDTYKKTVDELTPHDPKQDWDGLRAQVLETGMLNSNLMAIMPAETSAAASNSTNGIEPARGLVTYKQSKDTIMPQVVPSIGRYKNKYELMWDMPSPSGYLDMSYVMQKWIDQAMSVNFTYTPSNYGGNDIPESVLIRDILKFFKYGGKNQYYLNSLDVEERDLVEEEDEGCVACVI